MRGCHAAEPTAGNGAVHDQYSWTQTLAEVSLIVPVPNGTKGKDCTVKIQRSHIKVIMVCLVRTTTTLSGCGYLLKAPSYTLHGAADLCGTNLGSTIQDFYFVLSCVARQSAHMCYCMCQVGLKGQEPILEGQLSKPVQPEECLWSLDNSAIEMTLQKSDRMTWWKNVVEGEPAIDTSKVVLATSRLSRFI